MHVTRIVTAAIGVFAIGLASAQEVQRNPRNRDYDFSIGDSYLDSATTEFDGGTVVNTESTTGLGFNFDYRFADRWSVGAEATMRSVDFAANIAVVDGAAPASREVTAGELDSSTLVGHVRRAFGNWDRVEPYASVGLGFASIDTNIPDGPPVGVCWWHPWWGFVCDSVQPTCTTTDLMRTVGVGVRWDFGRRLFLDASVGRQWIDFENAHRPGFTSARVAIGFR